MHFFTGGGMPFEMSGDFGDEEDQYEDEDSEEQDDQQDGPIDNTKYYQIMQLTNDATQEEIKAQFKVLFKKYNPEQPDGDAQKFDLLTEAYQTLTDSEKKAIYDKYGTKGKPAKKAQQPQQPQNPNDLLKMLFGGNSSGKGKQIPKMQPTKQLLNVSLQNIYQGTAITMTHQRTRVCQACKGKGGENVKICSTCKGQGRVIQMYQMAPGMYQQVQKACDDCQGQGEIMSEEERCKICEGKKILNKEKIIEVPIEKGTPHGFVITIPEQGNEIPDARIGDLMLIVQEQPHEIFTRKGADLYMKKTISLMQALLGFHFQFTHLDKLNYAVRTQKGEITADHQKKVVLGLGMPFFKDSNHSGNLIIEFKVKMPKRGKITKENLQELKNLLPGKVNPRPIDDKYEMLEDFDKQTVNTSEEGGHKKQDQEEYEEGGGCQAQ